MRFSGEMAEVRLNHTLGKLGGGGNKGSLDKSGTNPSGH